MSTKFGIRPWLGWSKPVAAGVAALIALMIIFSGGCSSGSQNAVNSHEEAAKTSNTAARPASASAGDTATEGVPISLADAGEYGTNVYDDAKASDWNSANLNLERLRGAIKEVRTDVVNQSGAADRLDEHVAALGLAVAVKDRQTAMHDANEVTLDVANLTTAYNLSVPVELTRLDYYGRELEIWAEAEDINRLQETGREMRRTWDSVRTSVNSRDATEAKKFEALVAQAESAKTLSTYAIVAPQVLNEVDNLEQLFY
jgi:hypothetical protein